MLIKILIAVAALIVLFLVIVALQPSRFRVARSVVIGAPAPLVFEQVNDFHKWEAWSPYEGRDRDEEDLRRSAGGDGRQLCLVGKQPGGRGSIDDHGQPAQRADHDQAGIR